ncbi:MAG: hypothetical protein A2036_03235 [Omnitrophica bacterium GWA2_50_21]|nr:MAG: hypothetical protein A2036_03235 [Omnitrophica bacterium GWA2_50_21]
MTDNPEEIKKHVKVYITVFAALAFLTVLTVAASYLKLPLVPAILVALFIASLKAGLVAGFFMHLLSEKQVIISILAVTVFFFVVLMLLPALSSSSLYVS